jgi:hypothetical protein
MFIEVTKKEKVELTLETIKYVCFADKRFYRFTPLAENIEVLSFRDNGNEFELELRAKIYEHEVDILNCQREFAKEISAHEFNETLQSKLLLHLPPKISEPEADLLLQGKLS